jgi:hypothetical protein
MHFPHHAWVPDFFRCFHPVLESVVSIAVRHSYFALLLLDFGNFIIICFKKYNLSAVYFWTIDSIVVGEHCYGTNVAPSSFLWLTCRRCGLHKLWWKDNEQATARGCFFIPFFFSYKRLYCRAYILFPKDYQFTLWFYIIKISIFNSLILLGLIAFGTPLFCNYHISVCSNMFLFII